MTTLSSLPPSWLMHLAVAAVWLYEGLWCKLLNGEPRQKQIVEEVAHHGFPVGGGFLKSLGFVETIIGLWVLSGITPLLCVIVQTALLLGLNGVGVVFARQLIHDPAGMIVKNFAFLVLAWVSAGLPAWR